MIGFDEQEKLFDLIGRECNKDINALIIGGSAMLFYNFSKTATKDIDIVLFSEDDQKYLINILKRIGFKIKTNDKKNKISTLVFNDYILDIFTKSVFHLKISKGMLDRIKEKIEFGRLTLSVISPEDILLSKSMTDRIGDREDAFSIIKETNINWDVVIKECIWQSENADVRFCVYLYDFLDDLVHDFKIVIPKHITVQIKKIYRNYIDSMKPRKGNS